jgi:Gram positive anchor.
MIKGDKGMNRQKYRILTAVISASLILGATVPSHIAYAAEVTQPSTLTQQELLNIIQTSYDAAQIRSSIEDANLGLNLSSYNQLREEYKDQLSNRLVNSKYSYATYDTVQAVQDFINTEVNNIAIEQPKLDAYPITFADGETADSVKSNIGLPGVYTNGGASLMWNISDMSIIDYSGTVTRGENDTTVTLTGHSYISAVGYILYTTRTIKVLGTNTDAIETDSNALSIQYSEGDAKDAITSNIGLSQQGANGTTISWQSNKPSFIENSGVVHRPTGADESVSLTATITKGSSTTTKVFELLVKGLGQAETPSTSDNGGSTDTPSTPNNGGTTETPPTDNTGSTPVIDNNTSSTPVIVELPKTEGSNGEVSSTAKVGAIKDGKDTLVIKNNDITMSIPESAIDVGSLDPNDYVKVSQVAIPFSQDDELYRALPSGVKPIKDIFKFTMQLFDGSNSLVKDIHQFANDKKVSVSIKLTDSQIAGLDTSKLSMYYYDEITKKWVEIGGTFDKSTMAFTFETPHFTNFALMEKTSATDAKLPQTGSVIGLNFILGTGLILLAVGSSLVLFRRKKV